MTEYLKNVIRRLRRRQIAGKVADTYREYIKLVADATINVIDDVLKNADPATIDQLASATRDVVMYLKTTYAKNKDALESIQQHIENAMARQTATISNSVEKLTTKLEKTLKIIENCTK